MQPVTHPKITKYDSRSKWYSMGICNFFNCFHSVWEKLKEVNWDYMLFCALIFKWTNFLLLPSGGQLTTVKIRTRLTKLTSKQLKWSLKSLAQQSRRCCLLWIRCSLLLTYDCTWNDNAEFDRHLWSTAVDCQLSMEWLRGKLREHYGN